MKQQILFTLDECKHILSFIHDNKGHSNILLNDRDYSEWLIDSSKFDFILDRLNKSFEISSLLDGRIIRYNIGNYFAPHKDQYGKFSNRYKTLIIQLSDDYDGGELEIDGIIADKTIGNTILFDSNKSHSISKISNGVRYSLVFWLELQNFNIFKKSI